jgi:hypothetical protein
LKPFARVLIVCALVAAQGAAVAGPRHYDRYHHHHHPGHHRPNGAAVGAVVLGLALAVPLIALARQADRAERAPEVVYTPPPASLPPATVYAPSRPAPVIYPRQGQSFEQQEYDSRECNRWATTQSAAMADAGVFQRAVEACMDGRGYTLR